MYATYSYDAVGNLLSITRNTGGVGAPTVTGITPNSGAAGATVTVSLAGTNLTGASLAINNPGILVRNVLTTPTSIAAAFYKSFAAHPPAAISLATDTTVVGMTPGSVLSSSPERVIEWNQPSRDWKILSLAFPARASLFFRNSLASGG